MHPGTNTNINFFWPLYLETHTSNVHLLNETLILDYNRVFWKSQGTSVSLRFAQERFKKSSISKRFLYICFVIYNPTGNGAHANALLYDAEKEVLEHFEPHGNEQILRWVKLDQYKIKKIKDFLESTLNIRIKRFNHPQSVCPAIGWQMKNQAVTLNNLMFNMKWKIGGYCAAWSMYYVLIRVSNPLYTSKEVQLRVFKQVPVLGKHIHNFYYDFLYFKLELLKKMKA